MRIAQMDWRMVEDWVRHDDRGVHERAHHRLQNLTRRPHVFRFEQNFKHDCARRSIEEVLPANIQYPYLQRQRHNGQLSGANRLPGATSRVGSEAGRSARRSATQSGDPIRRPNQTTQS